MTTYEMDHTGAKLQPPEPVGRVHLPTQRAWVILAFLLVVSVFFLYLGVGYLGAWSDLREERFLLGMGLFFLAAGLVPLLGGWLVALRSCAYDQHGIWSGHLRAGKLVSTWDKVVGISLQDDQLHIQTARRLYTWPIHVDRMGNILSDMKRLASRHRHRMPRRPLPAVRWPKMRVLLTFGGLLFIPVAVSVLLQHEGLPPAGIMFIAAVVALPLCAAAVLAGLWMSPSRGMVQADGLVVGRRDREVLIPWGEVRTLGVRLASHTVDLATLESHSEQVIDVTTDSGRHRLHLQPDAALRVARMLVRRCRNAHVLVEFAGEVFPPAGHADIGQVQSEGETLAGQLRFRGHVMLAIGIGLVALCWWVLSAVPELDGSDWSNMLLFGLPVICFPGMGADLLRRSRLIRGATQTAVERLRAGDRSAIVTERERFGIPGLWQPAVTIQPEKGG
ncbi:MAG: hypothetical protein ACLFV7_13845 [Phycisphaerae bacterium]